MPALSSPARSARCGTVERLTSIVETQRLKLREFGPRDVDELASMVADETQMRFYPRPKTRDEASAWISRNLVLYRELGFGFRLIESLLSSDFLGYCGIRPLVLNGGDSETEIGWHVRKMAWNQGIATEVASTVRDAAFSCFGLSRLVAVIHPEHIASRRVAEKIGMRAEGTTVIEDYPAVIYAIVSASWR